MPHADGDEVDNERTVAAATTARRPSRRAVVLLCLVAVLLGLLLTSAALFSATTGNEDLRLEVGTLDVATAPVALDLDAGGLAPGDVVATPLTVRNDGSLELRWSLTSTVDDEALADLLEFEIRTEVSDCDATGAAADGVLVAGPTALGSTAGSVLIGDPVTGADAGDRVLAPNAAEALCLRVELPASAGEEEAAGRTVTATLRIDAEQTAANP